MLLTLTVTADRPVFPGRGGKVALDDLPARVREELGLHGLNLSTDLLAGADRAALARVRDRADKARCSCLLLIERAPLDLSSAKASVVKEAQERAGRVLQAAALLGCNAAAIGVKGPDDAAAMERAIEALKPVVERAERLEINCLISPAPGLTEAPERVTDLIKRVGGFRIGTFPDFQAAARSADPAAYLRRLTPYASAVAATTLEFGELAEPEPEPPPKPRPSATRKKAAAAPPPKPPPDEEELEEDGDDETPAGLRALLEDVLAERDVVPHIAYDLTALVRAVVSVGYDGSLAVYYAGEGDVTLGIEQSREALDEAIDAAAGD